jgi:hypothetical protein
MRTSPLPSCYSLSHLDVRRLLEIGVEEGPGAHRALIRGIPAPPHILFRRHERNDSPLPRLQGEGHMPVLDKCEYASPCVCKEGPAIHESKVSGRAADLGI